MISFLSYLFMVSYIFCSMLCNAYEKYIVVTTIQYPTPALKKLAQLPDWRLVVVADKKTPKDWHLDNCDFLSVEQQEQLPYAIVKELPWNHYCRKNIGYVWAIEHGARIIYETDDDNDIIGDTIDYIPEYTTTTQAQAQNLASVNVYAYFGRSAIWPRGYPLSAITQPYAYTLSTQESHVSIQQGVVNNDPDVDAIFRLTHPEATSFEHKPPLSLAPYTFCPFNSQNTLFYYDAFWALLVPMTTKFRVCDIWRGYCAQRLLWDLGAQLCFLSPTAVQYRNDHNLLHDFADELDLYLQAENLIKTLTAWHSDNPAFAHRMKELMNHLVEHNFYKEQENRLLAAWIEDLQRLGYQMPRV